MGAKPPPKKLGLGDEAPQFRQFRICAVLGDFPHPKPQFPNVSL